MHFRCREGKETITSFQYSMQLYVCPEKARVWIGMHALAGLASGVTEFAECLGRAAARTPHSADERLNVHTSGDITRRKHCRSIMESR